MNHIHDEGDEARELEELEELEAYCDGRLSAAQVAQLEARARGNAHLERMLELYRPIQERRVQQMAREIAVQREHRQKRQQQTRRGVVQLVPACLAACVLVLVVWAPTADVVSRCTTGPTWGVEVAALPEYQLSHLSALQKHRAERGDDAVLRLGATVPFSIALRPADCVQGIVDVHAFVRGPWGSVGVDLDIDRSPAGALRLSGYGADVLTAVDGRESSLMLVLTRPQALEHPEEVLDGDGEGMGWQVIELPIEAVASTSPRS